MPNQITLHASAHADLEAVTGGATNVLRAEGIRIAAAGLVRLSSRDSVGRIILRSATDKARAVEILLANDIDAN
jgi:hypothetical protein